MTVEIEVAANAVSSKVDKISQWSYLINTNPKAGNRTILAQIADFYYYSMY